MGADKKTARIRDRIVFISPPFLIGICHLVGIPFPAPETMFKREYFELQLERFEALP
jgi:hypothetical protein